MGLREIKLPEIGEGVNEGELVSWMVQTGDHVESDQPIAELMTDKATVEVPSPFTGTVKELGFAEGDSIEVGQTLIILEVQTEGAGQVEPEVEPEKGSPETESRDQKPELSSVVQDQLDRKSLQTEKTGEDEDSFVLATPSTRRLARENNVSLSGIKGTGLSDRITREDVLKLIDKTKRPSLKAGSDFFSDSSNQNSNFTVQKPDFQKTKFSKMSSVGTDGGGEEERQAFRGIRKKIAENLQLSKQIIPHFTLMDEANVTGLVQLRKDLKPTAEKMGVKITYMPFVMKALMVTMGEFPKFNAVIDESAGEIIYKKYFNIGCAVDTPKGLLVPVIKKAHEKTIYQLSQELVSLADKARRGELTVDEMRGATFTITNIGSLGGICATPIINHPEVAIFGMYKIQERPIFKEGKLESASFMNFTVTCDHRLIDGAEAARFLSRFIERVENPGRLLIDMI